MPTPKLKGRVVIGLCLAGMLTFGCAPSEPPEVSLPQTEPEEPETVQMATDPAPAGAHGRVRCDRPGHELRGREPLLGADG